MVKARLEVGLLELLLGTLAACFWSNKLLYNPAASILYNIVLEKLAALAVIVTIWVCGVWGGERGSGLYSILNSVLATHWYRDALHQIHA